MSDLVPVIKDNVHCMYDRVSKTFCYPISGYTAGKNPQPVYDLASCDTLSTFTGD